MSILSRSSYQALMHVVAGQGVRRNDGIVDVTPQSDGIRDPTGTMSSLTSATTRQAHQG